jgi:hypothetical protein
MAGLESLDTSLTQDIEDMQIQEFKIIQTSKKKTLFCTMVFISIICVTIKILQFLNFDIK